ncbi:MAG: Thymidylate synthase ThyX [bacterium ADurb.Bin400]|nr:MAG: Thymidylate synthase ThyX [bacterium ADurb.Bin400]
MGFPAYHARVYQTKKGTPYLQEPGAVMIAKTDTDLSEMRPFLEGFDPTLEFDKYLDDPVKLPSTEQLIKTAGQICYVSYGPKRTTNQEADKYFTNIKVSGHGSVLEHASVTFLFYGVSRTLTHELVRHRAGFAFSQVSQRYVSGKVLRFVERPEFVNDPELHKLFEESIDASAKAYENLANMLMERQSEGAEVLSADRKTDLRKKVQQCARTLLLNAAEAPIVVTANMRSWRHFIEMRGSEHAEIEIRRLALLVYRSLKEIAPLLFNDYQEIKLTDGTIGVEAKYKKV